MNIFKMSSSLSQTANDIDTNNVPGAGDSDYDLDIQENTTDTDGDRNSTEDDGLDIYIEALLRTILTLHLAVVTKNIQMVQELKKAKSDKDWIDMMLFHTKTIDELEREGKCKCPKGVDQKQFERLFSCNTPLHIAMLRNNEEMVRFLIESIPREKLYDIFMEGKVVDHVIDDGILGQITEQRLVSNGLSFLTNSENRRLYIGDIIRSSSTLVSGDTLLHVAVQLQDMRIAKMVCDFLHPDQLYNLLLIKNAYGGAPIHYIARDGYTDICILIRDSLTTDQWQNLIQVEDMSKRIALHYAIHGGHTETVKYICESVQVKRWYSLLKQIDIDNRNCLHIACLSEFSRKMLMTIKEFVTDNKWQELLACPLPPYCFLTSIACDEETYTNAGLLLSELRTNAKVDRVLRTSDEKGKSNMREQ